MKHKSNGDKNKNLSFNEYLNEIKSYLKNIINYLKISDSWKIQFTITINSFFVCFVFFEDIDE